VESAIRPKKRKHIANVVGATIGRPCYEELAIKTCKEENME